MVRRATRASWLGAALLGAVLQGCPPPPHADRPDAQRCMGNADCNPAGMTCGELFLCVQSVCAVSSVEVVCPDAMGMVLQGNCSSYLDCNGAVVCGPGLVSCVGNMCDTSGPSIDIPCPDAGPDAGVDASTDASRDAGHEGG